MRAKGNGCSKEKLLLPFSVLILKHDIKLVAKKRTISLAGKYATRPVWTNRSEDSTLCLIDHVIPDI
jgi:hypothetical protein